MLAIPFKKVHPKHAPLVGGKALSLAALTQTEVLVPDGLAVTTEAYHAYLAASGIRNLIRRELARRPVDDMRWEELWDASLRIRNAFLKTPMPSGLRRSLVRAVVRHFDEKAVAVRSSAPGEDASGHSFAGLHESYLNVSGGEAILDHIRLVWASLWSDGALLYRKELGLDIERSAMAVVIQEFVSGSRSGVAFGRHPTRPECVALEAVHGLNQGLVDGSVAPDRWTLDASTGEVLDFHAAERSAHVAFSRAGVALRPLPAAKAQRPPLSGNDVQRVFARTLQLGAKFRSPQDMEWTMKGRRLYVLQSRPITTSAGAEGDKRSWYLSLRRSADNLRALRERIEDDLIPKMEAEARRWERIAVGGLPDKELLAELAKRCEGYQTWLDRYWKESIPFAHGVRLFGQFYNDAMRPEDPYEFVELLAGSGLLSVERNSQLHDLAAQVRANPPLAAALKAEEFGKGSKAFRNALDAFGEELAPDQKGQRNKRKAVAGLLLRMAQASPLRPSSPAKHKKHLERKFLSAFQGAKRKEAEELLDLGRASYRLRDDDNLYLGRIARQVEAAREEAKRRKLKIPRRFKGVLSMRPTGGQQHAAKATRTAERGFALKARQLLGQPAGPGYASGKARVIRGPGDLRAVQSGEILVCDAVDPNMTFVMPLSGGIVECRGGMLVHGAIIAREYGIPCITGVSKALSMISTGDSVQVDGYLGIVTVG